MSERLSDSTTRYAGQIVRVVPETDETKDLLFLVLCGAFPSYIDKARAVFVKAFPIDDERFLPEAISNARRVPVSNLELLEETDLAMLALSGKCRKLLQSSNTLLSLRVTLNYTRTLFWE